MHILDFLKYTSQEKVEIGGTQQSSTLTRNFYYNTASGKLQTAGSANGYTNHNYAPGDIISFMESDDIDFLEASIKKHWVDVTHGAKYGDNISFAECNPYHLIYAYLLENTRMFQIFDKLITMFQQDEKLSIVPSGAPVNIHRLMSNTEQLFYKDFSSNSINANIVSSLRPSSESTRRNAYHRLLGLGLNWNDYKTNTPITFHKAEFSNKSLIAKMEMFLKGFWDAYTNASNTAGVNNTDMHSLEMHVKDLRLQLMSRRSDEATFNPVNYNKYHLSHEEFSSVIFASWLKFLVTPKSPLADYLNCTANTHGGVLAGIGSRVGLAAHSKADALFDLADDMAYFMRSIELGFFETGTVLVDIVKADATNNVSYQPILKKFLNIINNWEIATGRSMKDTIVVNRSAVNKMAMAN